MTSPVVQDSGPFREWAPLTTLLQKLPAKIQIGLFTQDINFTCIDVVPEFIAVGTNHGLVYWFNRKSGELETLTCENASSIITCVQIVSTVDYMVAAGNNQGVVTIFQIPKHLPDSIPETLKPKRKKQVERFNISGLHKTPVTAVEWSKNGIKLFSGDQNGLVVITEMDFYMHLSKSTELLNEKYCVVQMSYLSGLLLISTLFRTIIVDQNKSNQVTQVGQKERKTLGKLGAIFSKNKSHVQEPVIYACRPGLRIWEADKNGIVLKTLILKEAVKICQSRVELLNPISHNSNRKSQSEPMFGIIKPLTDNLLVTFNEDVIYIINPNTITITSVITDLRRVNDIACSEDEIFVLEGERNILRIACYPETSNYDSIQDASINQLTPIAETSRPWGLTDLTLKLKTNPIIPAIPIDKIIPSNFLPSISNQSSVIIGTDTTSVVNAEEAVEVPPIVPLDLDTPLVTGIDMLKNQPKICVDIENKSNDRKDIFQKISEQDFEEVVFTPTRKGKRLSNKKTNRKTSKIKKTEQNNDNDFIPESGRNLETIQKSIQDKEKLLSNYLDLDLSKYMDKCQISTELSNSESAQVLELDNQELEQNNYEIQTINFNGLADYSENNLETQIVNQLQITKPDTDEREILESHFNALSKEFVKSTMYQDNDDWILLG